MISYHNKFEWTNWELNSHPHVKYGSQAHQLGTFSWGWMRPQEAKSIFPRGVFSIRHSIFLRRSRLFLPQPTTPHLIPDLFYRILSPPISLSPFLALPRLHNVIKCYLLLFCVPLIRSLGTSSGQIVIIPDPRFHFNCLGLGISLSITE